MKSLSLHDTEQIAKDFLASLPPQTTGATIVGLHGDLGAGKTAFTQALARSLGVEATVTSPTFIIEKIYSISHPSFTHLIHIDAYRLESGRELMSLGWSEISKDPHNLIVIEWPEKIADIPITYTKELFFTFIDEQTREIVVQ